MLMGDQCENQRTMNNTESDDDDGIEDDRQTARKKVPQTYLEHWIVDVTDSDINTMGKNQAQTQECQ